MPNGFAGAAPPGNTREVEVWRAKAADVRRGKPNIEFADGAKEADAVNEIKRIIAEHTVVLFIKGTRQVSGLRTCSLALKHQEHHVSFPRDGPLWRTLHMVSLVLVFACLAQSLYSGAVGNSVNAGRGKRPGGLHRA